MRRKTLKLLACSCAVAMALSFTSDANAQTVNVPASITINNTITTALNNALDFGSWVVVLGNDDVNNTVIIAPDGTPSSANTPGVDTTDDSARVQTVAGAGGSIDATTPVSATVSIHAVVNDFTNANIVMGSPTKSINAGAATALSILPGTPDTYVSSAGGATDTITIGASAVIDATPVDGTYNDGSIDVVFSY